MRTTVTIDDDLLAEALRISGVDGNAAVLREGLRALIERESARRLARLGGSDKKIKPVTRRRTNRA
jgi:Arc/MetJ family transcription regulator